MIWQGVDLSFTLTTMDSLSHLLDALSATPELAARLTLAQLYRFVVCCARVKNEICIAQPADVRLDIPPEFLPPSLLEFLAALLEFEVVLVIQCWSVFKTLIWNDDYVAMLQQDPRKEFYEYGIERGYST